MDIAFDNPKHEALANDSSALCRKFDKKGSGYGDDILATLDILKAAPTLASIPHSFRPHPLQGSYKGCFAVNVTKKFRIIFRPNHDDDPCFRIDTPDSISSIIIIELFIDYHH